MYQLEKKQVIEAIGTLGRRVTTADVATKTGLPVLVCTQMLNQVASETGGHLQVSTSGDVAYAFAPGFSNAYLAKGIQRFLQTISEKLLRIAFYLLRISFGIILILSLITIAVIILVVITILAQSGRGDRDSDDNPLEWLGDFHMSFWDWIILRDVLLWNTYTWHAPVAYRYDQPTIRRPQRSNFLLNCFSFLFGDGNPNEGLAEKRWQVIAQAIKQHNNVMTSEQLAPYTGANPKNDDGVLPVLVRFNGSPEVTDSGNIIYAFESMQPVATTQHVTPPAYLSEFPWKFTNVPGSDLVPVYIVAFLNFFGAWGIWYVLLQPVSHGIVLIPSLLKLAPLLNFLVCYGTAFLVLPLVRYGVIELLNSGIASRNARRLAYAQALTAPTPELAVKLKEASAFNIRDKRLETEEVFYTTEKNALEQKDDLDLKFQSDKNIPSA